jgi:hypothetical protein
MLQQRAGGTALGRHGETGHPGDAGPGSQARSLPTVDKGCPENGPPTTLTLSRRGSRYLSGSSWWTRELRLRPPRGQVAKEPQAGDPFGCGHASLSGRLPRPRAGGATGCVGCEILHPRAQRPPPGPGLREPASPRYGFGPTALATSTICFGTARRDGIRASAASSSRSPVTCATASRPRRARCLSKTGGQSRGIASGIERRPSS